jgi:hypothetical protein
VIKDKNKATIIPVIKSGKNAYLWPNLHPRIEVSSRASIKATIQTVLEGGNDAYVWPNFSTKNRGVIKGKYKGDNPACFRGR